LVVQRSIVSAQRSWRQPTSPFRDLLLHCSGLPAYSTFHRRTKTPEEARDAILSLPFEYDTESKTVYSCMGFISLQMLLEKLTGKTATAAELAAAAKG